MKALLILGLFMGLSMRVVAQEIVCPFAGAGVCQGKNVGSVCPKPQSQDGTCVLASATSGYFCFCHEDQEPVIPDPCDKNPLPKHCK